MSWVRDVDVYLQDGSSSGKKVGGAKFKFIRDLNSGTALQPCSVCVCVCVCVCVICARVCMCGYLHVHTYVYRCLFCCFVCLCVCMCACVCSMRPVSRDPRVAGQTVAVPVGEDEDDRDAFDAGKYHEEQRGRKRGRESTGAASAAKAMRYSQAETEAATRTLVGLSDPSPSLVSGWVGRGEMGWPRTLNGHGSGEWSVGGGKV